MRVPAQMAAREHSQDAGNASTQGRVVTEQLQHLRQSLEQGTLPTSSPVPPPNPPTSSSTTGAHWRHGAEGDVRTRGSSAVGFESSAGETGGSEASLPAGSAHQAQVLI